MMQVSGKMNGIFLFVIGLHAWNCMQPNVPSMHRVVKASMKFACLSSAEVHPIKEVHKSTIIHRIS